MTEVVVLQWHFNLRGKAIWYPQDPCMYLIDLPAEGEMTRENRGRIDSFVVIGNIKQQGTDKCGLAQFVRVNNRSIKLKLDPPDCIYAYSIWHGDQRTIVGDISLWHDTFVFGMEDWA